MILFRLLPYLGYLRFAMLPLTAMVLLTVLAGAQSVLYLLLTPAVFERLFVSLSASLLIKISAIQLGCMAFQFAIGFGISILGSHLNQKVGLRMRTDLLRTLFRKSQPLFDKTPGGEISKNLMLDSATAAAGVRSVCLFCVHAFQFFAIAALAYRYAPWFFRIYVGMAVSYALWSMLWKALSFWSSARITTDYGSQYGFLAEAIGNIRNLKLLGLERPVQLGFARLQIRMKAHFDLNEFFHGMAALPGRPIIYVGYALALLYSLGRMREGSFSVGTLAAFTGILFTAMDCVIMGIEDLSTLFSSLPSVRKLSQLRKEPEESRGRRPFGVLRSGIEFRDVGFSYPSGRKVLDGISFRLEPGSRLGIVGPSGCGKSTLLNLLLKLYEGHEGSILIDKIPLEEIETDGYRESIGYLGQGNFALPGSIRRNIDPKGKLGRDEIATLCCKVGLEGVLERLDDGMDTVLNEDGSPFSGGELQRLFIARVLAKKPSILVLDEVTSGLDPKTEAFIMLSIEEISAGKTVIMITHRLEVARQCDQLLILENGRAIGFGTWQEVNATSGPRLLRLFQAVSPAPSPLPAVS